MSSVAVSIVPRANFSTFQNLPQKIVKQILSLEFILPQKIVKQILSLEFIDMSELIRDS